LPEYPGRSGTRLSGLLGRLLLAGVSLGVCALAVEAAARLVVALQSARPHTVGSLRRYHPTLGWDRPPGGTARHRHAEFSVDVRFNARGLRGPDRGHAKPPGVRRVLLLGDSFTEGYTVEERHTVRAVLERGLNSPGCGRHEVLNGGVSGYGTDQAYLFFRQEGRRYRPDVVVLLFFGNDLADNSRGRKKPYFDVEQGRLVLRNSPVARPPGSHSLQRPRELRPTAAPWRGSRALELLGQRTEAGNPALHRRLAWLGLVRPLETHGPTLDWLSVFGPDTPRTEAMWRRTAALLGALQGEVESAGARLAVFYVPARFEVNDRDWRLTRSRWRLDGTDWEPRKVFGRLARECGRRGIPLVDSRGPFRRAEGSSEPAYLRRDPHWTVAGNAIAARLLESFLVSRWVDSCQAS